MVKSFQYGKILLITTYTYPASSGSGKNAFCFARFLADEGHPVAVLTFNRNMERKGTEEVEGVSIHRIPYFPINVFSKILSLLIILPNYIYYVFRNDILVVYGTRIPAYETILMLGRFMKKRVIFRPLLPGVDDLYSLMEKKGKMLRMLYRLLFRGVDVYFSINRQFAESYRQYFPDSGKCVEGVQGVDTGHFKPADEDERKRLRQQLNIPGDILILVSAGFVIPRKGYREIIMALEKVGIPFLYVVVGEYRFGENHFLRHNRKWAQDTVDLGNKILGDRIRFAGEIDQVADYLRASDLFIHSAEKEGFPNALLEAMSCGLCCLVRKFPGMDETFCRHDQNMIIYEEAGQLPGLIEKFGSSREERDRIGKNAKKIIHEKGSFQWVLEHVLL